MSDAASDDPWAEFRVKQPSLGDGWSGLKQNTAPADEWAEFRAKSAESMTWGQAAGKAVSNAPASAATFAKNIVQPLLHPAQTAGDIADVGAGAIRAAAKMVLPESVVSAIDGTNPEATQRAAAKAEAVGHALADRYGSADAIKHTLATDPVGLAGDAALVLSGGGGLAARVPGMIGRAGEAVAAVGGALDPVANVGRAVRAGGNVAANVLGTTTGAGTRPIQEAFNAGRVANQAFVEHMRGQRQLDEVVDMAERGVNQMGRERSAAYNANMAATRADQTPLDMTPVRAALDNARGVAEYRTPTGNSVITSPAAANVHTQMVGLYNDFMRLPPAERTAEAFDALKRGMGAIMQGTRQGTEERAVASRVFNAVRDEIVRQVPDYAHAMQDYGRASDNINEIRRALSVNDRASTDTTLRKLQSTMRNNVNTNYGQRERMLDELAHYEPDLPASIAGQSLNTLAPRGLARLGVTEGLQLGAAYMNPMTLAVMPLQSPRLVGESANAAGRAYGAVERAMAASGVTGNMIANAARGGYGMSAFLRGATAARDREQQ